MSGLRLVVLGMMGRVPFGGQTWLYLSWLRGLSELGHDVWYVEDDSVWPYDPAVNAVTDDCSYAAAHLERCMERIGLADRWALRLVGSEGACYGMSESALDGLYRSCDALLNVVGATDLREEQLQAPFRVYVQTDPVTAELRLAGGDAHTREAFDNHHVIATYGENYGADDCGVPMNGHRYVKTRQPVALDLWPAVFDAQARHFTTIGNYRQEGEDVVWRGDRYSWSKHEQWERYIDLPRRTDQSFCLAMQPDAEADARRLREHGWDLTPPLEMSLDPFGSYPGFIRASRAEFTVAKDQNVRLRSGWFSERDACYLASGKPVVAQDTGFGNVLPTGEGLFAFSTMEEALTAIEAINSDYEHHCEAARAIAEEFFDAPGVASRLLTDVGVA
ncbi:MAG: glycosyltransferase [Actinobacteria bacterium]|nr:MAG: glycosyltransferase [Actinomycetota bacterium]